MNGPKIQLDYDFELSWKKKSIERLAEGVDYIYSAAVPGQVAEFGTASGFTAAHLAYAIKRCDERWKLWSQRHNLPQRTLYLFDSFQGLPEADNPADSEAPTVQAGFWGPGAGKDLSPHELRAICSKYLPVERIQIIEGWYADSLSNIPPGTKFALVHLDCDLFQSALAVLDNLFQNKYFAPGCAVYFDDWNNNKASNQHGERKAWLDCLKKYSPSYEDWGSYGPLGHRFILSANP